MAEPNPVVRGSACRRARYVLLSSETDAQLAQQDGCSPATIRAVRAGKTWRAVRDQLVTKGRLPQPSSSPQAQFEEAA